uniref:Patatin-like phospholipase n=1 Tax=Marseillevirus LCMAC201 TaxID=2506605 RepID=A0A481YW61_9VIRU|nr:MAG: patatin-like phospholipase [Marseillevirus LCMAC201]
MNRQSIENVCFKGGGMKGNAFVGVDRALTELGVWPQIKRFVGSSAGAIFAGAAACRIPYAEMVNIIENTDFSQFKDSEWGIAGEGVRLIEQLGIYEGKYFYDWYGGMLKKFVGDEEITLQGVYERFGTEIILTTTDLTKKKLVYLDRVDYPNMELRDAVRRSMSLPLFFVPVKETDEDGLTHVFIDGGCTNNFALDYCDRFYETPEEAFDKTIGFNLEIGSVPIDPKKYIDQTVDVSNVIDLVTTLINTLIEENERIRLTPNDWRRTITINTLEYKSTDFDMKKADIQILAKRGYDSTMAFFCGVLGNPYEG